MKQALIVFAALLLGYFSPAQAPDSAAVDTPALPENNYSYLLYNYTSTGLNNFFNEDMGPALNRINIDFDYEGNSNTVPAGLLYALLFNTPISKNMIARTDKAIKKRFKFEDNMRTGINYRHYIKKWGGTVYAGFHHREIREISGPKDAFETIFYGNARFEDDTADFSNIRFQNYMYNQYSIGVSKRIDYGKYQMEFGATGAFIQCFNNQQISTGNNTWLYTAPDGEYIDINYDLTFNAAKEGLVKFFQVNGAGASVDVHLAVMNNDKWRVAFDLTDMGYMTFRKNPMNYNGTKTIKFQGIVIPNLLDFSSQTFDTLNLDSAVRANLPSKTGDKYSLFMPFTAQLVFSKPLLNNRMVLSAGLMYRHMAGYYAYGFAKVNYFIKRDMMVGVSAGGGGMSRFNLGVEFSKKWKYFDFTLGTANLIGLVAPPYYPGSSVYLRLATSF